MTQSTDTHATHVLSKLLALSGQRKLIAIAGPPGSGKSTLADALCTSLQDAGRGASVVPMDGFHLDNRILKARGLLHRKGAPETFDSAGFLHLTRRIAARETVVYPVFDRPRDIAIAGAAILSPETEYVIFEGNYLLLDHPAWDALHPLWSYTIKINTPRPTLKTRLLNRWLEAGLPHAEATARCDENDLPNAELVLSRSRPADVTLIT